MSKIISIETQDTSPFYYGMKIWAVNVCGRSEQFHERCPVCDDTRTVNIKGFELDCPYCQRTTRLNSNYISVHNYTVEEWIVYKAEIFGPLVKRVYSSQSNEDDLPQVVWSAFNKSGNGYGSTETKLIRKCDFRNLDRDDFDIKTIGLPHFFWTKSEAEDFCKFIHEQQKELLDRFNSEHGTAYAYPFEVAK